MLSLIQMTDDYTNNSRLPHLSISLWKFGMLYFLNLVVKGSCNNSPALLCCLTALHLRIRVALFTNEQMWKGTWNVTQMPTYFDEKFGIKAHFGTNQSTIVCYAWQGFRVFVHGQYTVLYKRKSLLRPESVLVSLGPYIDQLPNVPFLYGRFLNQEMHYLFFFTQMSC